MDSAATKRSFYAMAGAWSKGEAEFWREPVKFSFWIHGGGPDFDFTSDLLAIESLPDGTLAGKFTRARFDASYEPPFLAEEFTHAVSRDEAKAVLARVFESSLFAAQHPAEYEPPMGDLLKEDWKLGRGSVEAEKHFFEQFPAELTALREACNRLMRTLEQRGARKVVHPKRK